MLSPAIALSQGLSSAQVIVLGHRDRGLILPTPNAWAYRLWHEGDDDGRRGSRPDVGGEGLCNLARCERAALVGILDQGSYLATEEERIEAKGEE
jgi:hypothetical protein